MTAARIGVILCAHEPNILGEGIWIAAQNLPVSGGGDVGDRVRGSPLDRISFSVLNRRKKDRKKGKWEGRSAYDDHGAGGGSVIRGREVYSKLGGWNCNLDGKLHRTSIDR